MHPLVATTLFAVFACELSHVCVTVVLYANAFLSLPRSW